MLRVALISYHTSPLASLGSSAAGGMNLYVRRLAEGLSDRGHEVDIFTRRECADCDREQEFTPGARLVLVRAGPTRVISKSELGEHTPTFARNVASYASCRALKYDVIHSHYWLSGLAAQALRTSDQPLIHMFHTLSRVKRRYQPDAGQGDPPSRDYGELQLLKSGHPLVFSTEAEIDDVEETYGFRPVHTAIIPPGVDGQVFAPSDRDAARRALGLGSGPIILCVGRMDRAKGVDTLLEAVASLRRSAAVDGLKLIIVGGDDRNRDAVAHRELDRLGTIVKHLRLEGIVVFEGLVPQDRLSQYYAASDVCAVPSRYESFGMVALEALSSGRPVVGFRSRGLEQTIRQEKTGILVPSGDVHALGRALAQVLGDGALARRMGFAARESVKEFSWERVADQSAELYEHLVRCGPRVRERRTS